MKTVITDISARHYKLIEIFFNANELTPLGAAVGSTEIDTIHTYKDTTASGNEIDISYPLTKTVITYSYDEQNDECASKIAFMAMKHLGFTNMLHDFLNKCDIPPHQHII
jgi:hypothetical protein